MDNVWEREAREPGERNRAAYREAQRQSSNVYGFRRLKWGMPKLLRNHSAGGRRQFTVVDLMIVVIVFSAFGFVAALAWPH